MDLYETHDDVISCFKTCSANACSHDMSWVMLIPMLVVHLKVCVLEQKFLTHPPNPGKDMLDASMVKPRSITGGDVFHS